MNMPPHLTQGASIDRPATLCLDRLADTFSKNGIKGRRKDMMITHKGQQMKPYVSMVLCFALAMVAVNPGYAAKSKEIGVKTPMKYEGGSLALNQHDSLETFVSKDGVVLVQGKQRFTIPVKSITEVSYGNDVHRRVGAAFGVAVFTLGIGALMLLIKTKKHYVGIVWNDANNLAGSETPQKGGVIFKVGKGDYRGFMASIEGVAGIKAVNADLVGSGGTSKQ